MGFGRKTPSVKSTRSEGSTSAQDDGAATLPTDGAAESVPELETPADGELPSESGRLKQLLGLLKRSMGVKDLAAVRLSLPATMLHPMGNLEFWTYLDRPDVFALIGQSDDPLERMISVLRWSLTKDLKWRDGVVKPYNSVLGETFRSIFDTRPAQLVDGEPECVEHLDPDAVAASDGGESIKSGASSLRERPSSVSSAADVPDPRRKTAKLSMTDAASDRSGSATASGSTAPTSIAPEDRSALARPAGTARISFLNEQVSHHPPISGFWVECEPADSDAQRIQAYGIDQISASFSGTSVKCSAGSANKGIFVRLPQRSNEEYQLTHPTAAITGFFRGTLHVVISGQSNVSCPATKLRAIVHYPDESWVGKNKFKVAGVVFEADADDTDADLDLRVKDIDEDRIVARFEGSWRGKISWWRTRGDDADVRRTLIDMTPLLVAPKTCRPIESMEPNESRRLWKDVTEAIHSKQFGQATKFKQVIEQRQREAASKRTSAGESWKPRYFDPDYADGRPRLTEDGRAAVKDDLAGVGYPSESS